MKHAESLLTLCCQEDGVTVAKGCPEADLAITETTAGDWRTGTFLVIASAAFFGLTGVLTKSISADAWTIACWRGLVGAFVISGYVAWRSGGTGLRQAFSLKPPVLLLAAVGAVASLAFIAAFKNTYVANVTIIYATAPFAAAFLGYVVTREGVRRRTMLAACVCLCGVSIIVAGSLGSINLVGDGLALAMTWLSALYMVLIRRFRDAPVVWAGALSGFMVFACAWAFTDPTAVGITDGLLVLAFGFTFASALILWTEGTRFISAADSGLIGSAEIPFAIFFAMLLIGEIPPAATVSGGILVLAGVMYGSRRRERG